MLDKFNFYDLLGYLLPGAAVVLTLYWLVSVALGLPVSVPTADFGTSVFFLGLSYLVGQLVHNLASIYEDQINKLDGGERLTERLLMKDPRLIHHGECKPFSDELAQRILDRAHNIFGPHETLRELFEQCYALVVQEGLIQHTEIFQALYGLARSMLVASAIGVLLGWWLAWNQVQLYAAHLLGVSLPPTGIWTLSAQRFFVGLATALVFALTIPIWNRSFNRFRGYFATSVYFNFLAWYGQKYPATPPPNP